MGFDQIDRKFQKPKKIELECVDCQSTKDVKTHSIDDEELALCAVCLPKRRAMDSWYYG